VHSKAKLLKGHSNRDAVAVVVAGAEVAASASGAAVAG
jgi:hypothetical protein